MGFSLDDFVSGASRGLLNYGQQEKQNKDSMQREQFAADLAAKRDEARANAEKRIVKNRRLYLGSDSDGPPSLRYEGINDSGEVVDSGNASAGELAQYNQFQEQSRTNARIAAEKEALAREDAERERSRKQGNFQMKERRMLSVAQSNEAGRNSRAKEAQLTAIQLSKLNKKKKIKEDDDDDEMSVDDFLGKF